MARAPEASHRSSPVGPFELIATGQSAAAIRSAWISIRRRLPDFYKDGEDGEDVPADAMANLSDPALPVQAAEFARRCLELTRAAKARSDAVEGGAIVIPNSTIRRNPRSLVH